MRIVVFEYWIGLSLYGKNVSVILGYEWDWWGRKKGCHSLSIRMLLECLILRNLRKFFRGRMDWAALFGMLILVDPNSEISVPRLPCLYWATVQNDMNPTLLMPCVLNCWHNEAHILLMQKWRQKGCYLGCSFKSFVFLIAIGKVHL